MPVNISETADGLGIVLRALGEVSGREIIDAQERAAVHPNVGQWLFGVFDQSAVAHANYNTVEVHTVAQQAHRFSRLTRPGFVVAVVAASDYQFGIVRMWQLLTDDVPWRTCVFRDVGLANSWLREEVKRTFQVELPRPLTRGEPVL